jgi:hypothetical protein
VTLKVREDAKVTRFGSVPGTASEVDFASSVSGRTSSAPMALAVPVPNQLLRMSSRATVRPGSIENVV